MWEEKLLIVSGKGGVGKTALASAIAVVSAKRARTILVTLDDRHRTHPFFAVDLTYKPRELRQNLFGASIDSLSAIREYVRRKLPFAAFYDTFLKSRVFRDFAEAAPGFQELMSLGKVYDLVTGPTYDRVVLDAPATGHLRTLLDVPEATMKAVQVGPLNHNARKIRDLILDPERTRVLLAALPEEMAIQEALELEAFCAERRMRVGPVLLNQRVPERFLPAELDQLRGLEAAGALGWGCKAALAEASMAAVQSQVVAALDGIATLALPRLTTHEPAELVAGLAEHLDACGVELG